ncbi:MAG TPA: A/G-specific adenine glycosylase [Pseudomonadales bacterium]
MSTDRFARALLDWFDRHGRKDLPWQQPADPYRVWVSEIMLQQTQVATVIPYYQRFLARFPDVERLAAAELDEVLHLWTGLGYYARARHLHAAAREIVARYGGRLPDDVDALASLPGIGRSTAGAIVAIAYGRRAPILDGNVKRVLARYHAVTGPVSSGATLRTLWQHADAHTPAERVGDYTQAIMDLGATLCTRTRPRCGDCPVAEGCAARARGAVEQFPERRPQRDKPVRAARLFLLIDPTGRCLLEQRPARGLWGGLWTPPERSADTSAAELCAELAIATDSIAAVTHAAAFRHTFSHFHLDIEPVYVRLARAPTAAADRADLCWYAPGESNGAPALGLSAPAARLLKSLTPQPGNP